jgi:hypothetical protein
MIKRDRITTLIGYCKKIIRNLWDVPAILEGEFERIDDMLLFYHVTPIS